MDGIAATAGPGLIVCLTVGLNIGKSIATFSNKPFIGVNHLEGHALSPGLETKLIFLFAFANFWRSYSIFNCKKC